MVRNHMSYCLTMLLLFFCSHAIADHPTVAFGANSAGPIHTISADPLPSGTLAMGIQTEATYNDAFSTGQLISFAENGSEGVHSADYIINTSVSVAYGITEHLSISARLPYINRRNIREGEGESEEHAGESEEHEGESEGEPEEHEGESEGHDNEYEAHAHGDSSGLGDLVILGQYRAWQNETTNISVNLGVKAPTGETKDKDNDGVRFETEFQGGSGSWDFLFGVAASKQLGSFGYYANVLYNLTTKGAQSTELGDVLSYNTALTYRINADDRASYDTGVKWDLMLELNGERRSKDKISGNADKHSGGNTIFLAPGIRISAGKFGGFLSYGVPIVENLNGKQADVDQRVTAGLTFVF